MKKKIYFFNVQMFKILKTAFIIWLAYSAATLVLHIPHYKLFLLSMLLILVAIFLTGIGSITKHLENDTVVTEFKTIFKKKKLKGKLKIAQWWNYDFKNGAGFNMGEGAISKPGSNDVASYLLLTDKNGDSILLRELILLDTRFPNESPYNDMTIDKKQFIFDIQRSDKMHERLLSILKINRTNNRRH